MFFRSDVGNKKRPWTFGRFGDELEKGEQMLICTKVVMASKHGEHMVIWNSKNHALPMKSADRTTIIANIAATNCGENQQKGLEGKDSVA